MCSWNRKSCHLNTAQTVECQPAGEYVSSIRISCLVNFLQVPKSSQFDMHLLHWSNGNALFPGQDSETQLKRWNLQKVSRIQKHQRESESVNKQETACEPDTPPYWFQSWIIYAPSGSITLYHSSFLLCFFHLIVDPAARLIRSHLKFAKDFASRALRLSKTAGSTPRLNCPTPTRTLLSKTWKNIPT